MKSTFQKLLFFGLILILHNSINASNKEIEIENLRYNWRVYDEKDKSFHPYLSSESYPNVYFNLDKRKYQGFELKIELGSNSFIFLNDWLILASEKDSTYYFDIDSLILLNSNAELSFSTYFPPKRDVQLQTYIVDRNRHSSGYEDNRTNILEEREINKNLNEFITTSLLLLGIIVMFRTSSYRTFSEYFSITDAFSKRQRFELITSLPLFSANNLAFVALYSLIVSISVLNFGVFQDGHFFQFPYMPFQSSIISGVLSVFFLAFFLILMKRFLVYTVSSVFNFQRVRDLHFYTYFRLSILISLVFFGISILNGIRGGGLMESMDHLLFWFFLFALLIRILLVFLVLNSQLNFHKLQIIVYLCSTEIIPLIFLLKIFSKY
ncbi:MAG: DUF4271 domain-containing protein [Reichenbachiella sp.]